MKVFFVFVETFKVLPLLLLMRVVETERSFYCSIGVKDEVLFAGSRKMRSWELEVYMYMAFVLKHLCA